MKKFFKLSVICLLVLCSCFTFVACGKNDDETAKINEANYLVLKSSASKMNNVNNFNNGMTSILTESNLMKYSVNSEKYIPKDKDSKQAEIDEINAEFGEGERECSREIVSYNKNDRKGYSIWQNLTEDTWVTEPHSVDYFEKDGSEYYYYSGMADSYKYEVDGNYYRNYFQKINGNVQNYIVSIIEECDTFLDFTKKAADSLLLRQIGIKCDEGSAELTEKDGVYTLTINSSTELSLLASGGIKLENAKISTNYQIEFTADSITGMYFKCELKGATTMSEIPLIIELMTEIDLKVNEGYNIENQPDITKETEYDFGKTEMTVSLYLDGILCVRPRFTYGDTVHMDDINSNLKGVKNSENIKWYLDEACTQEFDATTYPSYNIDLYARRPELQEGYYYVVYYRAGEGELINGTVSRAYIDIMLKYENIEIVSGTEEQCKFSDGYKHIVNGVEVTGEVGSSITLKAGIINTIVKIAEPAPEDE